MTKCSPFRHFNTSPEIIQLAVMLYVRFPLSLRPNSIAEDQSDGRRAKTFIQRKTGKEALSHASPHFPVPGKTFPVPEITFPVH
jgi:hypothetical protein